MSALRGVCLVRTFCRQERRGVLQMRTSAHFDAKNSEFFEIYGVSARTRRLGQCRQRRGRVKFPQCCADVFYGQPLIFFKRKNFKFTKRLFLIVSSSVIILYFSIHSLLIVVLWAQWRSKSGWGKWGTRSEAQVIGTQQHIFSSHFKTRFK